MKTRMLFFSMLMWLYGLPVGSADKAVAPDVASEKVAIRKVEVKGNAISGEVTNKSPHPIRNIELLVQYHWLWNNEFKPGRESPGKAVFVALDKELRPGESATFSVPVDSPETRADGYYMPEVTLAGFTEIIPPALG